MENEIKYELGGQMTDKKILEIDWYDLCGCAALFMTDKDKIEYYWSVMKS